MTSYEHYESVLDNAPFDHESFTVLVARGVDQAAVAAALRIDTTVTPGSDWDAVDERTAYALADLPDGVVAVELTGYGDPSLRALEELTRDGGSAGVVRSNIQAHYRFGCARDGRVLFDDDEYTWVDDHDRVPEELRELFLAAWDDPDDESDDAEDHALAIGLAMCEVITGVQLTAEHLHQAMANGFRPAPSLTYVGGDSDE